MSDFTKQYKRPPSTFGNAKNIKEKLVQEQQEERKTRRTQEFEKCRKEMHSQNSNSKTSQTKTDDLTEQLLKWKAERARKKKEEQSRKKPPFKTGVVNHRLYSPTSAAPDAITGKKKTVAQTHIKTPFEKGITKATEKRLKTKAAKLQAPATSTVMKFPENEKSNNEKIESGFKSFAPSEHKFNAPSGLPKVFLFGGIFIEDSSIACEPTKLKLSSDKQEVFLNSLRNDSMKEMKYTGEYFNDLFKEKNKESYRLLKLCEEWKEIQLRDDITEDIWYRINQTIKQTIMLLEGKFKQFFNLVLNYESDDSDMPITVMDLYGFWDTILIQVKNCDSRFAKLQELRATHWQEQEQSPFMKPTRIRRKKIVKTKVAPSTQSSLRALTLADKRGKNVANIRDKKGSRSIINIKDECIMPCISNKIAANLWESSDISCKKRLHTQCANVMYTSTPLKSTKASTSNCFKMSLITMKINKLYKLKSSVYNI